MKTSSPWGHRPKGAPESPPTPPQQRQTPLWPTLLALLLIVALAAHVWRLERRIAAVLAAPDHDAMTGGED